MSKYEQFGTKFEMLWEDRWVAYDDRNSRHYDHKNPNQQIGFATMEECQNWITTLKIPEDIKHLDVRVIKIPRKVIYFSKM